MRVAPCLEASSCTSLHVPHDQQREERSKKNKRERSERPRKRGTRRFSLWFLDATPCVLVSVSGPRRVALLSIRVLWKAAGRWPADVYHLVLIVGLDQVVRERWPFIWQRGGLVATLSLSDTEPDETWSDWRLKRASSC